MGTTLNGVFVCNELNSKELYVRVKTEVAFHSICLLSFFLHHSNKEPHTSSTYTRLVFNIQNICSLVLSFVGMLSRADAINTGQG